jgi:hypothetical protein
VAALMPGQPTERGYVDDVLELLWPGHHRISRPGRRGVVMMPPGRPRLVLPRQPAQVAAAALRNYNTASVGVGRGRLAIGALALRCGAGCLVPCGLVHDGTGIEAELSSRLGHEVFVGVYIGPPRVAQKPVLQVLDAHGGTRAFAKISVNERTTGLIEHEADTLRTLAGMDFERLRVPEVLYEGLWRGHRLVVQRAVERRRRQPVDARLRSAAGSELFEVYGSSRRAIVDSAFAARLLDRVQSLPDSTVGRRLREAVDRAVEWTGEIELRFGAAHADWVPWNMAADGVHLDVWDWEGFVTDVPSGFDELHWRVNHAVAIVGQPPRRAVPAQAAAATDALTGQGMGRRAATATALWYVLDLATGYAADGEDLVGGTPLSRLDAWAVPALAALLQAAMPGALR